MYTTPFLCASCGNADVAYASSRFIDIMESRATDEEIFGLLDLKSKYTIFKKEKRKNPKMSDKQLINQVLEGTGLTYKDFLERKTKTPTAAEVYKLLNIYKFCCMRSVYCLPVWPNYSDEKPPGSNMEFDTGAVNRYVKQKGMKFEVGEISPNQYVETGGKFVSPENVQVEEQVSNQELRNLKV